MKRFGLIALLLLSAAAAAPAQDAVFLNADGLVWSPAPPTLPKGASMAVLQGDPGREGPFTMRLKAPGGFMVAPHYHTRAESLTVIAGTLYIGMGDVADKNSARALRVGGFHQLPARAHHYAFTKAPTEVQIHGDGPFDIVYLNVADDPSIRAGK